MARARNPFGRAQECLRAGLREGLFPSGGPLIVVELAQTLNLSPTPVREALAHLAGEGLIVDQRGRGYFAPRHDAGDLVELHQLHMNYVAFALRLRDEESPPVTASRVWGSSQLATALACTKDQGVALRDFVEALFSELVAQGGHKLLSEVHRTLADKLAPIRKHEDRLFTDLREEAERLAALRDADRFDELETAIRAYHDRRIDAARRLVEIRRRLR